jgi:hypothetical protein
MRVSLWEADRQTYVRTNRSEDIEGACYSAAPQLRCVAGLVARQFDKVRFVRLFRRMVWEEQVRDYLHMCRLIISWQQ